MKRLTVQVVVKPDPGVEVSDGYHTFGELYAHRIQLWITLCRLLAAVKANVWRSAFHSDGSTFEGWFALGLESEPGKQITYHLPMERWHDCDFAEALEVAPPFDGHSSDDVLKRLAALL